MRKIRFIALLTLMMTVVSLQGKAQEASTVIISGRTYGTKTIIEIIKPDYSLETKESDRKEEKHLLVEIKKELDFWINEGYKIEQANSNGGSGLLDYRYTYILIKVED